MPVCCETVRCDDELAISGHRDGRRARRFGRPSVRRNARTAHAALEPADPAHHRRKHDDKHSAPCAAQPPTGDSKDGRAHRSTHGPGNTDRDCHAGRDSHAYRDCHARGDCDACRVRGLCRGRPAASGRLANSGSQRSGRYDRLGRPRRRIKRRQRDRAQRP